MIITMQNDRGVIVAVLDSDKYTSEVRLTQDIRHVLAKDALGKVKK